MAVAATRTRARVVRAAGPQDLSVVTDQGHLRAEEAEHNQPEEAQVQSMGSLAKLMGATKVATAVPLAAAHLEGRMEEEPPGSTTVMVAEEAAATTEVVAEVAPVGVEERAAAAAPATSPVPARSLLPATGCLLVTRAMWTIRVLWVKEVWAWRTVGASRVRAVE